MHLIPVLAEITLGVSSNSVKDGGRRAGVAEGDIHLDTASGAKSSRPKLDLVMKLLRAGDTLMVTRLDRLGR